MNACKLDCDFCEEFDGYIGAQGRIIASFRNKYVLLPTLGCFRQGYCLFMPIRHERSFASLGKPELIGVENELELLRSIVAEEFSSNVILAEHGPAKDGCGANCCDHGHIHVIPVESPRSVFMSFYQRSTNVKALDSLDSLTEFKESSYIYLSCGVGQHLVWTHAEKFERQFVRRVCANLDNIGPMFNWRLHPFVENMNQTFLRMRRHLVQNEVLALGN